MNIIYVYNRVYIIFLNKTHINTIQYQHNDRFRISILIYCMPHQSHNFPCIWNIYLHLPTDL